MDRRMVNIISLSFNLVTQLDSRAIQKDSKSMKTIAFMTMYFLPVSTVATIFGAQFFTVGSEAPSHLQISPDFWILWAIAAPFTLVVVIVWRGWPWVEGRAREIGKRKKDEHMV
jgi:Mg2+ and Co2+ transporter CorA